MFSLFPFTGMYVPANNCKKIHATEQRVTYFKVDVTIKINMKNEFQKLFPTNNKIRNYNFWDLCSIADDHQAFLEHVPC